MVQQQQQQQQQSAPAAPSGLATHVDLYDSDEEEEDDQRDNHVRPTIAALPAVRSGARFQAPVLEESSDEDEHMDGAALALLAKQQCIVPFPEGRLASLPDLPCHNMEDYSYPPKVGKLGVSVDSMHLSLLPSLQDYASTNRGALVATVDVLHKPLSGRASFVIHFAEGLESQAFIGNQNVRVRIRVGNHQVESAPYEDAQDVRRLHFRDEPLHLTVPPHNGVASWQEVKVTLFHTTMLRVERIIGEISMTVQDLYARLGQTLETTIYRHRKPTGNVSFTLTAWNLESADEWAPCRRIPFSHQLKFHSEEVYVGGQCAADTVESTVAIRFSVRDAHNHAIVATTAAMPHEHVARLLGNSDELLRCELVSLLACERVVPVGEVFLGAWFTVPNESRRGMRRLRYRPTPRHHRASASAPDEALSNQVDLS